ncbi:hypothetical protein ACHAXS_010442 [Conticribra weissflogii]
MIKKDSAIFSVSVPRPQFRVGRSDQPESVAFLIYISYTEITQGRQPRTAIMNSEQIHAPPPPNPHQKPKCHRPLSRAARQLFRREAYPLLIHYHGQSPWRGAVALDDDTPNDGGVDSRRRKRKRLPLVEDPNDDLNDDEWYALLSYAIDHRPTSSESSHDIDDDASATTCPLHPKNDVLLSHDRNTYLLHRRYRVGVATNKFGGLSLPWSGRASRSALWSEERQFYGTNLGTRHILQQGVWARSAGNSANSIYLFQCGICEKTFLSRFYLDKHLESHWQSDIGTTSVSHEDDASHYLHENSLVNSHALEDVSNPKMICPAEDVCEALGGISVCAEVMYQMSPYYGPGTLLGKEYIAPASETSFVLSVYNLIEHWYHHGDQDEEDQLLGNIEAEQKDDSGENKKNAKHDNRKPAKMRQGDFYKVTSEMRHRIVRRNQLLLKAVQHRHLNMQQFIEAESSLQEERSHYIVNNGNENVEKRQTSTPSSCDEEDTSKKFQLCRRMMTDCFGDDTSRNEHTLTKDLISHICEPLLCHHLLHRMAGHSPRHIVQWNDEWAEHHSHSLGVFGWMLVVGIGTFYIVLYLLGLGGERSLLPSHGRKEKNKLT